MFLLCLKILSDTYYLIIQSKRIFSEKKCKKATFLGTFHGFTF